jgi:hypothetical protein
MPRAQYPAAPFHAACCSGGYTWLQLPGLLTRSMVAMVAPRNTSSDASRRAGATISAMLLEGGIVVEAAARLPIDIVETAA